MVQGTSLGCSQLLIVLVARVMRGVGTLVTSKKGDRLCLGR